MHSSARRIFLAFALPAFFASGCKKDAEWRSGYHVKLVSGADQSGPIGAALANQLVFAGTYDGHPVHNGYLRFSVYDCDQVSTATSVGFDPVYPIAGQLTYQWRLNGSAGKQILSVVLLDSTNVPRDSLQVSATALAAAKGWNTSGCLPLRTSANTFCRLSSGRLLTGLNQIGYPYYSDDNGASWHALKSFSNSYAIEKMIATPSDEIFLSVAQVGVFYSPDGGNSWEQRNKGLTPSSIWGDMSYTATGKLFAPTGSGIFISSDKGANWHQVTNGLYYSGFREAASTSDGTVYAIYDNEIYYSTDGGEGWRPTYTGPTNFIQTLFIDTNDDLYASGFTQDLKASLFVSRDKAQTWQLVHAVPSAGGFVASLTKLTKQDGNYYFYATDQNLLNKTPDFSSYSIVNPDIPTNNGRNSFNYIIAENGEPVMSTEFFGMQYFIP